MKSVLITPLFAISLLAGCAIDAGGGSAEGRPSFRIRSGFTAALNADEGWAGALNESVTVTADQPFRVRFELARPAGSPGSGPYRLQYRRNAGAWTDVEAHDFPYPVRDLEIDFEATAAGARPEGWTVLSGAPAGLSVAADVLQARAEREPLIGLYSPPWPWTEMTAEFRLPAENRAGVGFVFGHVDANNHGRVFLDAARGMVRVSRLNHGMESVVAERPAGIAAGTWLEIEIQIEGEEVEVSFGALEFTTRLGAAIPPSPFGFFVPANASADFREFSVAGEASTPRVSIVSCPAYRNGAPTTNLLAGSAAGFQPGAGIALAERTPSWNGAGAHGEFEWAVVVRRFADGAVTNEEGDTFDFRMLNADGTAPAPSRTATVRLAIPPRHVGGTYVEAPGQIGPWQAANGDLYFIMEPTETYNVFMMMKSADRGRTWREVDSANRPATDDLESVEGRQVGDTIHIIHQVTNSTRYHTFRTSDHPTQPDTWAIRDEVAARSTSVAQSATMVVRSDGSIVTCYVADTVHYSVRSASGTWTGGTPLDPGAVPKSAGPKAVRGANDAVHIACYGMDGTIWYRRLLPDGTLTPREQLASGLGTTRAEYGAVLPLVFLPQTNTAVIIYRQADGRLWERRVVNHGPPTPARPVTDRRVIQDAVDSQQPAADAFADGDTVHVLFVEETSGSIFGTNDRGGWQPSQPQVEHIQGSWVRGTIYQRPDGVRVYGYIYDAGSRGGAGMNRFGELVLNSR